MEGAPISLDDLTSLVVEAVNARDPELLGEAEGVIIPDDFFDRLLEVGERWPRMIMTRAEVGETPVAAVWLPDEGERYVPVGYLELTIDDDTTLVATVVDGVDEEELLVEPPPGDAVAEWESENLSDRGEGPWV